MATTMFSSSVPTLHYQEKLPRLPIPNLKDTVTRYLRTVEPLVTPKEFEETKKAAEEFLNGSGEELHKKLIEYSNQPGINSYIEEFHLNMYIEDRGPAPINVNPMFILEDDPTPLRNSQYDRAASLVISSLKFCQAVRLEQLEPDMWRSTPMCMIQYLDLFRKTRIPKPGKDHWVENQSNHIVVMSRGQLYWFNVFTSDAQIAVTEDILAANFRAIKEDAAVASDAECAACAVGVLTSEERECWYTNRELLRKASPSNEESLRLVESAIFVVCLDDTGLTGLSSVANSCLNGTVNIKNGVQVGTCLNRWFDKMMIIVHEDGAAGINFEHSFVDGHTVLRFASDIFTDTILRFAKTIRGDVQELLIGRRGSEVVDHTPRKIVWRLNASLRHGIKVAEAKCSDLISQNDMVALNFQNYGKRFIIEHNLSPDAFVQMIFQLAYYRLYGVLGNTYETVQTKKFYHGRTEAARPLTKELAAFVHAFNDNATDDAKLELLHQALHAHGRVVKACADAQGVDRHMYALKCIAQRSGTDLPAIYRDKAYLALSHNTISTSNCGNPSLRLFGFGPVCNDGYGIGYIIRENSMTFAVSSKHRQTQRYVDCMTQCFLDVQRLLESTSAGSFALSPGIGRGKPAVQLA